MTFLRFIAVLLIANSHLELIYPRAWMAGDGLLGNCLFYAISGFGLVLGDRAKHRPFLQWYWRRLTRIYPTVFITILIFAWGFGSRWSVWRPTDYFREFIWPTRYGFIQGIVIFYIFFYFVMKVERTWIYPALIVVLAGVYSVFYLIDIQHLLPRTVFKAGERSLIVGSIHYFVAMLMGGWLAKSSLLTRWQRTMNSSGAMGASLIIFVLYIVLKHKMAAGHHANLYFLLHFFTLLLTFCLFLIAHCREVISLVDRRGFVPTIIRVIAAMTLEIYTVHFFVLNYPQILRMPFPVNWAAFWLVSIILAYVVYQMATLLQLWVREPVSK
jgi:peptidoglycan/LPS O-acetylase OafA/YrhL